MTTNMQHTMTKENALDILQLLSALEGWSMTEQHTIPEYLHDTLTSVVDLLRVQILKT